MIGEIVARLIAAGTPPEIAAVAVTEAFAAGAATVTPQKSAEIRTDFATEKRRAKDRERYHLRKNSAENPQNPQKSAEIPNRSLTKEDSKKVSKRKGERISAEWAPSTEDQSFALVKGMTLERVTIETEKFRNYWIAKSGASAVKLDWSATWRNWVLSSLDRVPGLSTGPPTITRPDFSKPPPDYEARRAAYLAQKAQEESSGKTERTSARRDTAGHANGADRSQELQLSGGGTLRPAEQRSSGAAPDD